MMVDWGTLVSRFSDIITLASTDPPVVAPRKDAISPEKSGTWSYHGEQTPLAICDQDHRAQCQQAIKKVAGLG